MINAEAAAGIGKRRLFRFEMTGLFFVCSPSVKVPFHRIGKFIALDFMQKKQNARREPGVLLFVHRFSGMSGFFSQFLFHEGYDIIQSD